MSAPSLVLGTAGHIDHGKSTLIQALTGTDPDRLAEEKRRGITIELGFAQLKLPDGRTMGVVDVPGHERFVKQMISGATGIDIALMCIAADDGIMPQTEEHLSVLELLGVDTMVVALTKCDAVDAEWIDFMKQEIAERLEGGPYAGCPVIPVSAKDGTGLEELLAALAKAADACDRSGKQGAARLPIDRSFTIKGSGTVVTGTLWSGSVSTGDELELLPDGGLVRVRSVQEHGAPVDTALAGNRTALNLAGVGTDEACPGMMLATPGLINSTDRFDASVTYTGAPGGPDALETGSHVRVAHGTAEVMGRLLLMDGATSLSRGETATAQIRLDEALPITRDDRFILRSETPVHVIGGGRVLLAHPRRRTNLKEGERQLLEALCSHDDAAAIDAAVKLETEPASAEDVSAVSGVSIDVCAARLAQLASSGKLGKLEGKARTYFAIPSLLTKLASKIDNTLLTFHTKNPDKTGLSKNELKQSTAPNMEPEAFDALLDKLSTEGAIVYADGEVSHPRAGAGAKRREQEAAATLLKELKEGGLTPPTIADLASNAGLDQKLAHKALGALVQDGSAVRVGDFYFCKEAIDQALRIVTEHLSANGPSSASDLKDALGISRKHAIPLLEHFDAKGLTRRDGDLRLLTR